MEKINVVEVGIRKPSANPFSFANVKKETVGETFKCWNKLIKSNYFENTEDFKEIISPSVPLPGFEEKLRLILIDTLQLKDEVVNVFLSQNYYSIKRVLRCKWFFKNLSADFCIRDIFPRVSAWLRMKIINRLSKHLESTEEAEKYFTFVTSNYDSEKAEILLPKCSSAFILNYCKKSRPLVEYPVYRKQRILYKICTRYPETGLHIWDLNFNYKKAHNRFILTNCRFCLQYFAGSHIDLFIPFFKKHFDEFDERCFGGRLSWKLYLKLKDFVFESTVFQRRILNERRLFLNFNEEEKIRFICKTVLLTNERLSCQSWLYANRKLIEPLSWVEPSARCHLISEVFKKLFNLNFKDNSNSWTNDLLELFPSSDRQYFAEIIEGFLTCNEAKFKNSLYILSFDKTEPEKIIYLYDCNTAFDKFKNLITKEPDKNRRQEIMLYMIRCCRINKDAKGLEDVVNFVAKHHRNEDTHMLYEFVGNICNSFPNALITFSIYEKLLNLLLFCCMKGAWDYGALSRILERIIYLSFESNKDTSDFIQKFFDFGLIKRQNSSSFLTICNNKHSKTLLLIIGKEIKQWIQTNSDEKTSQMLFFSFINTCDKFNRANEKNKVVLKDVPGLAAILKEVFKTKYDKVWVEDWPLEMLETSDINRLNPASINKFLYYLLKRKSDVIIKHLDAVVHYLNDGFYPAFVKRLSLLGESDKLKEVTLNNFLTGDSINKRKNFLRKYSHLCTIEEFIQVIEKYIPQSDTVEEGTDYEFAQMQLFVPTVIRNIKPRWKNLNLILKFFRGDFLKAVIFSFYSCCYCTRMDFMVPFLKEHILKIPQRVSYCKDIIRLICEMSGRSERINFCLKYWDENKHYSIRRIILNYVLKAFEEEPTREYFKALIKCTLESEEVMLRDVEPSFKNIPDEYVDEYAKALWKLSQKFMVKQYFQKFLILNFHMGNVNLLSTEFCEEIIRGNLFNPGATVPADQLNEFVSHYCAGGRGELKDRVELVVNLMRQFRERTGDIVSFLSAARSVSLRNPPKFVEVFSNLVKMWPDCLSEGLYEHKLHCSYYYLFFQIIGASKEPSVVSSEFGKQLKSLYFSTQAVKDLVVIFIETLRNFLFEIMRARLPLHPLLLIKELMTDLQDRAVAVVAIEALPPYLAGAYENADPLIVDGDRARLNEILKMIENMNDSVLLIYFKRKFPAFKYPVKTA